MGKKQIDLQDTTIIMPFHIDTEERLTNLSLVTDFICSQFSVEIQLLEVGTHRSCKIAKKHLNINYEFIYDDRPFFYHTYYRNLLIKKTRKPIIILWDIDCICPPEQLVSAIKMIRTKEYQLVLPYDGRAYNIISPLKELYLSQKSIDSLSHNTSKLRTMYGHFSTGGIIALDTNAFVSAGAENEQIIGWGPEDQERWKRMEIYGYKTHRTQGVLFHFNHPRNQTSRYINIKQKAKSIQVLLNTCNSTN